MCAAAVAVFTAVLALINMISGVPRFKEIDILVVALTGVEFHEVRRNSDARVVSHQPSLINSIPGTW